MVIFVSHSTEKGDLAGIQRLDDLELTLTGPPGALTGHDVLLDRRRLVPGTKWRSDLDEWMAVCQAAILLLTPKALESFWVLKEATILAHRAARDSTFLLFPVLLDGLTRPQLTAKDSRFSPLYLDAIQRIPSTTAAGIAADALAEIGKLPATPRTPFDQLTRAIAIQLTTANTQQLEAICALLTGKPIAWLASDIRADRCAIEVARAIVTGMKGNYTSLSELMGDLLLAGLTKEAGGRLLRLASPLWVDAEAASPLAEVAARNLRAIPDAQGKLSAWSTAINGEYVPTFTADKYLRRAYLPLTAEFLGIHGGTSDLREVDLVARIRQGFRESRPNRQQHTDKQVDDYLGALKEPYFIILPPPFPDPALLTDLQTRYGRVTFIARCDAEMLKPGAIQGRVVPLTPPVDPKTELDAMQEFDNANDRINSV